jgi:hypothetical protein
LGRAWRSGEAGRIWLLLAGLQLGLALDMAWDWRWKLHGFWMAQALALDVYGERRWPQALALGVLGVGSIPGAMAIEGWSRGRRGLGLAMAGTMFSAVLWCSEAISFHFLDLVLYRLVGPVMLVSLLWLGLAGTTCAGVLWDGARVGTRQEENGQGRQTG